MACEASEIANEYIEYITFVSPNSSTSLIMPPKAQLTSTSNDVLSAPEKALMEIAVYLDSAVRQYEHNRGNKDEDKILQGIDRELVCIPLLSGPDIAHLAWKESVNRIFMEERVVPRTHPIIDLIGEEFRRADLADPKEVPDFRAFSTARVTRACKAARTANPRWNAKLTMSTLPVLLNNKISEHWWLPSAKEKVAEEPEQEPDGEADGEAEEDADREQEYENDEGDVQAGAYRIHEYMSSVRVTSSDIADDPPDMSADVVPMDEDEQETPRKGRAAKRAIVISPSSERSLPQAQRARRSSTSVDPVSVPLLFTSSISTYHYLRRSVVRAGRAVCLTAYPRAARRSLPLHARRAQRRRSIASLLPTGRSKSRR